MKIKLISIISGAVLVLAVGFTVYKTKEPAYIPNESNTAVSGSNQTSTDTQTVPQTIKKGESDDEGGFEDGSVSSPSVTTPTPTQSTPQVSTPAPSGITLVQIAGHSSRSSCWSAINGSVYDLTSWIPNHPGGEQNILRLCGIDGSDAYNGQHGGSRKTATILAGFKIGALAK